MRTLLCLEDALEDSPQIRSLLRLFEEDTVNLRNYTSGLHSALVRLVTAQNEITAAMQNLSYVLATYKEQKFPLDQSEYDMPDVATRLHQTFGEVASWLEILGQQFTNCCLLPVQKLSTELDHVTGPLGTAFHATETEFLNTINRYSKVHRKDAERKVEEANNDVFFTKRNFHEAALKYYSHMNAIQFFRYTHTVEPLLSLIYALRSFFTMGSQALTQSELTGFLTRSQEQIQSIHGEYKEEALRASQLTQTVKEMRKLDPNMYYAETPKHPDAHEPAPEHPLDHTLSFKQGYLFLKSRATLLTHWDRYFFFTQGSQLMYQGQDELAGQLLLDLSALPPLPGQGPHSVATPADHEDRRFTFVISLGPTPEAKARQHVFQAANAHDCMEWITAVNNLAGAAPWTPAGSPSAVSIPVKIPSTRTSVEDDDGPSTPRNTPATYPSSAVDLMALAAAAELEQGHSPTKLAGFQMQPIQFDLLGGGVGPEGETPSFAHQNCPTYTVRFLGSMEVVTDRGERMVHETIRHILQARAVHSIFRSSENKLVIDSEMGGEVLLLDPQTLVPRTAFQLSDLAYWSTHPENNKLFAFIVRTRGAEVSGPASPTHPRPSRFTCFVFEADESGTDICKALSDGTRNAFQALITKKTSAVVAANLEQELPKLSLDNTPPEENKEPNNQSN